MTDDRIDTRDGTVAFAPAVAEEALADTTADIPADERTAEPDVRDFVAPPSFRDRATAAASGMTAWAASHARRLSAAAPALRLPGAMPTRTSRLAGIALAAAIGAATGSMVTGLFHSSPYDDGDVPPVAAMQGTIAVLAAEVRALRGAVAASLGPMAAVSPEITGSVRSGAKPTDGWSIARAADGKALLRGNGSYFEVVEGSTVPGLGVVHRIAREAGRWVVSTDGGFVLSAG